MAEKKEQKIIEEKIDVTGVKVVINGNTITLNNTSSQLTKQFNSKIVSVVLNGNNITLKPIGKYNKQKKSIINSLVSHLNNMIQGNKQPFEKKMQVIYSHFPVTVEIKGKDVTIKNFLGEKKPRKSTIVGNAQMKIAGPEITVTGTSPEDVGQTCQNIIKAVKIKGKDIRVFQDGIYYIE